MWFLQDKLAEIWTPKMFIEESGSMELSSNIIEGREELAERDILQETVEALI